LTLTILKTKILLTPHNLLVSKNMKIGSSIPEWYLKRKYDTKPTTLSLSLSLSLSLL
jgi:hypothetical protein